MKQISIIYFIYFLMSCEKTVELEGDWKFEALYIDNVNTYKKTPFPSIFFKKDNYVIYFNQLLIYQIKNDSLILFNEDDPKKIINKVKVEFIDENNFNLLYKRSIKNREDSTTQTINYKSVWSKIN